MNKNAIMLLVSVCISLATLPTAVALIGRIISVLISIKSSELGIIGGRDTSVIFLSVEGNPVSAAALVIFVVSLIVFIAGLVKMLSSKNKAT